MTTIYVLWLRQVKRYMRSKPRIIASLGQPLLYLLSFGFGFGAIGRIRPDPRTRAAMAHMRAGPRATSVTGVRQICLP